VHLVGSLVRKVYHDARSREREKKISYTFKVADCYEKACFFV